MTNRIKPYKKAFDFSYVFGAYATIELIKTKPELVECVYTHPDYRDNSGLYNSENPIDTGY